MTYMFILKCALKLVLKNILFYDARSEKHQTFFKCVLNISVQKWEYSETKVADECW